MNTKKSNFDFADPFWGNGPTAAPQGEDLAKHWNWLKAQTGNTHPGALMPCGWVSVLPFSGAYSSHTKTMFTGLPSSQVRPRDQEFTVGCELVSPSLDGEGTVHHLPSPPSCWLE